MYELKHVVLIVGLSFSSAVTDAREGEARRLSVDEYRDKMKAGWIGQMVGVGWGGPTEFRWQGKIIPADEMPKWSPDKINQFGQDDIYVEMTFLKTLEDHGLDPNGKFNHTPYTFPKLISVCEQLVRQAVVRSAGDIERSDDGREVFVIPVEAPAPSKLEQCWEPGPIANSRFTDTEMKQIKYRIRRPEAFIRKWQVSGPYTKDGVEGVDLFDVAFGPEIDMSGAWKNVSVAEGQPEVVLSELIGGDHRVAYLRTRFHCPSARKAVLELGSDDGVKVWLNRKLVHANNVTRGVSAGEDRADIELKQGRNTMLVKITQGVGGWGFAACFAGTDGEALTDLEY